MRGWQGRCCVAGGLLAACWLVGCRWALEPPPALGPDPGVAGGHRGLEAVGGQSQAGIAPPRAASPHGPKDVGLGFGSPQPGRFLAPGPAVSAGAR